MAIKNSSVTTVASSIYTSVNSNAILTIHLCNYSPNTVQANIFIVPAGSQANLSTIVYSNVIITSYNTLIMSTEKFMLSNGDAIYANASANTSVTATVGTIGI